MMKEKDLINPKTGKQYSRKEIKDKFALPEKPNSIVDVRLTPKTKVRVGESGGNKWGSGGGTQWEIQLSPEEIDDKWYKNPRKLK